MSCGRTEHKSRIINHTQRNMKGCFEFDALDFNKTILSHGPRKFPLDRMTTWLVSDAEDPLAWGLVVGSDLVADVPRSAVPLCSQMGRWGPTGATVVLWYSLE